MLGCVLWSWDLGGHRGPCGLLQSWPETSSPACLKICPASSITSWEDKQCPHSWMRWWIGPGLACSSHFGRKPEGCWGPTELMGATRAWAPACRSPEHREKSRALQLEARGPSSLGMAQPALWKPLVSFYVHIPGDHMCLLFFLTLASRFPPNPVLICLMDSEKPGLSHKDRGTGHSACYQEDGRKPHRLPPSAPLELEPSALGTRFALTLFIWRELSMVYFEVFMLSLVSLRFFFPQVA